MMKMEIKLDEERIIKDAKYDLADMWRVIDKKFIQACTKEILPDGTRMYTGDPNKDYYTDFAVSYLQLKKQQWFADYCLTWVWYDNDDDESLPLSEEDVLQKERIRNPLFRVGS